jgi:flagellar biosynthesis/type III secretory pathway chaperone
MSDAQPLIEELDRLLLEEIEAYQHLVALQQEEPRLVIAAALEPFLAHLQTKEHLVHQLVACDKRRQATTMGLAPLLQLPATTTTLQQLSTRVAEPYASRFLHYRTCLRTLVDDLRRLNDENAALLHDSLTFVEHLLAFLERQQSDSVTYHPSGQRIPHKQGRFLSERI